jgi:hypothetical protein
MAVVWAVGCARSAALPPPASIPSAPLPVLPPMTSDAAPPANPLLKVPNTQNPWKPSVSEREWKYVVLHHTASSSGSVESIHESHLKRKDGAGKAWLGIGYHFVIGNGRGMTDGAIEPTFRWRQQLHGAHAGSTKPEYNQNGIGIVLVGNFEKETPTAAQMNAVKRLVRTLKGAYQISAENIIGHRDVRATECPGRLFPLADVAHTETDFQFGEQTSGLHSVIQMASQRRNLK